jgi:sugar (pentulose or hexulose) kinase
VGEGATADVTGTSTLLASNSAAPLIHPAVQNLRHVVAGWIPFTILDCGGLSMKWCRDLVASLRGEEVSFESVIEMAGRAPPASDGLLFYPYMLGERRRENTSARGGFAGITLNHGGPHFARAVMEGVALAMGRDLAIFRRLGVGVDEVFCVGGGARNELWNQIKADVLGLPILLPEAGVGAPFGCALLAGMGSGVFCGNPEELGRMVRIKARYEPNPHNREIYEKQYRLYRRVYEHLREDFDLAAH